MGTFVYLATSSGEITDYRNSTLNPWYQDIYMLFFFLNYIKLFICICGKICG